MNLLLINYTNEGQHQVSETPNPRKNKRNITGGEIHLNQIDPSDRVDDDATEDYDNSLLKALDVQPEQIRIFIESTLLWHIRPAERELHSCERADFEAQNGNDAGEPEAANSN